MAKGIKMDQRKLIRLGNSSFAIALPKDWVDKAGLKKGDNIFISPNSSGELIIQPTFKKENGAEEVVLNLEGKNDEEIARDMISMYIHGHKLIGVSGEKSKLKIAKEKSKKFLNLEIIEESSNKITFKDLLDIEDIHINNFIKRMDNNLKDMFSTLLNMLKNDKVIKGGAKEIAGIDEDVTKFYFLVWRLVNIGIDNPSIQSTLKEGPKSFILYFWLSYNLEQIGDELKRISRRIEKIGNKDFLKEILDLLIIDYNKSMKSFFDKDKESAKSILLGKDKMIKMFEKLSNMKDCEIVSEKFQQIYANIHHNSKIIFYNL